MIQQAKVNAYIYRFHIGAGIAALIFLPGTPEAFQFKRKYIDPNDLERETMIKKGLIQNWRI